MNAGETYFLLEQGIINPRDDAIAYVPFDHYATLAEARRSAHKLARYRITRCTVEEIGTPRAFQVTP